jgi:hypothetical protein
MVAEEAEASTVAEVVAAFMVAAGAVVSMEAEEGAGFTAEA